MQYRLNKVWTDSVQTGFGIMKLFAEILAFFDDHPEFTIISYGTAKVETGVITPATWKAWADTDGAGACPFADNSWFTVEAQKASADLGGGGSRQWQAKFQVTRTTGFDDCNVADTEHGSGTEGELYVLMARFSPDGGWVGSGTLDFVAVTASDNMYVGDYDWSFGALNHRIHLIGDDDTIIWVAQAAETAVSLPNYGYQKFGYLGETIRRNANHTKPELAIIATLNRTGAGHDLKKGSNEAVTAIFNDPRYNGTTCPSFSIGADNTEVLQHMFASSQNTLGANADLLFNGGPDPWTGDDEFLGIKARQNYEEHNSVLGQLRLIEAAGNHVSEGALFGDGTRLSVGEGTVTRGGLAVPWPGVTTSPIF
jgi:hypothetical protein